MTTDDSTARERAEQIESALSQHCGSQTFTRYLGGLLLTQGALDMAERCKAFWLLDVVASYQPGLRREPFQTWTLTVTDRSGAVVATDGNGRELRTQRIDYTDFPLDTIELWCVGGTIMLPSEY